MDSKPISCFHLGEYFQVDGKQLQQQYKDHISDYKDWGQKNHAADWMVFAENIGTRLTIDETSLSNGELYTIVEIQNNMSFQLFREITNSLSLMS